MSDLTLPALVKAFPKLGAKAADWLAPLNAAMRVADVNTLARVEYFLATIAHESDQLTQLVENLNGYTAERLLAVFPHYFDPIQTQAYARNGEAIANRIYGGRMGNGPEASGDGWRYRGRGPIGITGRNNYAECSVALFGTRDRLLADPALLESERVGAMSAAWYWGANDLNRFADAGDFDGLCDLVNLGRKTEKVGDSIGFKQRVAALDSVTAALA